MANTLRFKRGLVAGIPTGVAGEPLFTTDTFDLYIGNGTTNTRFQQYIASGTTLQYLRGDGSLATFPTNIVTGTGVSGQVAYWSGTNTQVGSNNLFWDATNNRLGIMNGTPTFTVDVIGTMRVSQASTFSTSVTSPYFLATGTLPAHQTNAGVFQYFSNGVSIRAYGATAGTGFIRFLTGGGGGSADAEYMRLTANGRLLLGTTTEGTQRLQVAGDVKFDADAATNGFYWDNTNKRLGIGTNAPANALDVFGATGVRARIVATSAGTGGLVITSAGVTAWTLKTVGTDSSFRIDQDGTDRVTIASGGSVGIGSTSLTARSLVIGRTITGATSGYGILQSSSYASDVTSVAMNNYSQISTAAATYTLANAYHYYNADITKGAGSTITNQYGFFSANIIAATNNYGFYGDIASGTGRWNLYMNGTADNYLNGNLGIGTTTPSRKLSVVGTTDIISYSNGTTTGYLYSDNNGVGLFNGATATGTGIYARTSSILDLYYNGNIGLRLNNLGRVLIGSTTDSGEQFQVTGTMKVTGASTFGGLVDISTGNSFIYLRNTSLGLDSKVWALQNLNTSGDFRIRALNDADNNGINAITISRTGISSVSLTFGGAATFSSSVTGASLNVTGASTFGGASTYNGSGGRLFLTTISTDASIWLQVANSGGTFYLGRDNSTGSTFGAANANCIYGDGSRDMVLFTNATERFRLSGSTGAATFSSSIQAGTAIAIGTTPDTNKPFKILKNINATVGINFENTSTGSSAFSAIQMGTDVTGGTAFTNLVYGSSGISEAGVYKPSGTSLVNTGAGGLNFLAVSQPIRFFTSSGNGTLRAEIANDGFINHFTGTAPSTNATDGYRQYSADVVAGNAAPHFRTENGAVIKIYQETTGVGNAIFSAGGGNSVLDDSTFDGYTLRQIVKALRNQGILA